MNDHTDPIGHDEIEPFGHDEIVNGPHPHDPSRSRRGAAVSLLAVGGLAAAGAALYVSNSAGAAPSSASGSTAASSSKSSTSSTASSATCPRPVPGVGPKGGPGAGRGGPGGPGGPGADGLITAVSSTGLTVRDLFGTSHTYKVTSSTTIHSGPTGSVKLTSLTRGEHVIVRTTTSTATAADIDVHPAAIDGAVTSITASAITVTDRDGFTRTIDTDAQTKYTVAAATANRSTIKSGSVVHAEGTVDANGTALDAARVDVRTATSAKPTGTAACAPGGRGGPHPAGQGPKPGRPGGPAPTGSGTRPTPSATTPSTPAPSTSAPSATTSR